MVREPVSVHPRAFLEGKESKLWRLNRLANNILCRLGFHQWRYGKTNYGWIPYCNRTYHMIGGRKLRITDMLEIIYHEARESMIRILEEDIFK